MTLVESHGLANRPGEPYPATFRMSVDPPGIEPGFPVCRTGVFPLDHDPGSYEWTGWESNPSHRLCKSQSPPLEHASPFIERSVRDSNPILRLTTATCCLNTYRPHFSDPGWNRTITLLGVIQASSPLDHGIMLSVTEAGVEPAKSPGSGHRRAAVVAGRSACWRIWA